MSAVWTVIAICAAWVAFAYLGYPVLLLALRRLSPRPALRPAERVLPVSVIIAVHNGERELERKLENTLALDYPGPLEILVSSDGSTDRTCEIAESFAGRGVVLLASKSQDGKEAAQARAVRRARGEILVFTDVGAELERDALRHLARPFADPSVGCASSEDVVESGGGEGAYVRFEMALRRLESDTTTLVGLSGSLFAARRELCDPWPTDLASDFRIALEAARRGLRAVSVPGARARFKAIPEAVAEWKRKVRTVRRGLAVLTAYRDLLHPRHGRVALSLWGHKVARFTAPFALLVLFAASALAATASSLAQLLVAAQGLFYGLGAAALRFPTLCAHLLPRLAGFFLLVNASILAAWAHHAFGQRAVVWTPTER